LHADVVAALPTAQCAICGSRGEFSGPASHLDGLTVPESYNLREGLVCGGCGSISRDRGMVFGLAGILGEGLPLEGWTPRPELRLFETSGYRGHPPRFQRLFDYFNTQFLPPDDLPATIDGRTTANLEDLPYPDGFFDLVVTTEVLEHVGLIDKALAELHRVLDPMGHALITVPYVHEWPRTSTRVHRWHDRDVFLYPPEYHAEETLVYRIYGRDFLTALRDAGFGVTFLRVTRPDLAIAEMDLIIASKAPYLDISAFASGPAVGS
jgi:SAM-dependent methyltransferase